MSEKLKVAKEKLQQINSKIEELQTEKEIWIEFIEEITLSDKLYSPMSELKNYTSKEISSIDLVYIDECDNLKVFRLNKNIDDACYVNDVGKLYSYSLENGIIEYSNIDMCYIYVYNYKQIEYDFIGYYNLQLA